LYNNIFEKVLEIFTQYLKTDTKCFDPSDETNVILIENIFRNVNVQFCNDIFITQ